MEEEYKDASLTRVILVAIIMIIVLGLFAFYLYPKSAIGNPICKDFQSKGYYETEWDTAGHESCKMGYSTWSGTESNSSCLEERFKWDSENMSSYGFHCVWGGAGYWIFVICIACICMMIIPLSEVGTVIYFKFIKPKFVT